MGVSLQTIPSKTFGRTGMGEVLKNIAALGFYPTTVIDVGVANGTGPLYEVYPDSYYLLIEPLIEFENKIGEILQKVKGEVFWGGCFSESREIAINVHLDHLAGSSLFRESMGTRFDGVPRKIRCERLDTLVKERTLAGPYLLKIDAQGAEIDILRGSTAILEKTELILLEASLFEFMVGSPQFAEVIHFMTNLGYVTYDLFGMLYRPLDNALGQVHIAFVRENSSLRRSPFWDTVRSGT